MHKFIFLLVVTFFSAWIDASDQQNHAPLATHVISFGPAPDIYEMPEQTKAELFAIGLQHASRANMRTFAPDNTPSTFCERLCPCLSSSDDEKCKKELDQAHAYFATLSLVEKLQASRKIER